MWHGWDPAYVLGSEILSQLHALHRKVDRLMAAEQDLQNDLDTIKAGVTQVVTKLTDQAATIASLQAQLAAGTPVTQAQLDALHAEASGIATALQAAVAPPAAPAAPAAPTA